MKGPGQGRRGRGQKAVPAQELEPVEPEILEPDLIEGDLPEILEPPGDAPDAGLSADASHLLPQAVGGEVRPDRALVTYSPLQAYLAEVRRIPLLTREEEYALAVRFRERGDLDAAYRLVTSNLRLVVKIAMEFQRSVVSLMDLIQEGNIGLMQAVQKFDPYKNVKLSSYASWWIKAYILRYILNNWRMVKIGTTQAQRKLFFNLQKEKDRLEAMGFAPTTALLAERLDVSQQDVIEMDQRLGQAEVSTDATVGEDSRATVLDLLPAGDARPDEQVVRARSLAKLRDVLREFSETLSDKDRYIFENRMVAEDPLTLQEIGERYGVTRERIHQIESGLQKKLRAFLEARGIQEA